jgi:signal peptidase II
VYETSGKTVVIKDFFELTYTVNTGAAWSFLSGVSWAQTFFKVLTMVSLVLFGVFLFYAFKQNYKFLKYALVLVIAGTIGNFIDRILINGVIDFLSFTFWGWDFPVFNVADSCLTVGVIMIIVHYCFIDKDALFRKKNKEIDQETKEEKTETVNIDE